jgi:hypothetical protein
MGENIKIIFKLKSETKTCYRFENQDGGKESQQTLYLKKETIKAAKIDPAKGLVVTLSEATDAHT